MPTMLPASVHPALRHERRVPAAVGSVSISDPFWQRLQAQSRDKTLPAQLAEMERRGYLQALTLTWREGDPYTPHVFWESDLAKWIEAASYSLAVAPDAELEAEVDRVIGLLAAAQQDDGYLNAYWTTVGAGRRFTDHQDAHELYCAGHLIEAGVAHFESTGKRTLVDVVIRYADLIDAQFAETGPDAGGYDGHPEIELALMRLYRLTGDERYAALARRLLDNRGTEPAFFPRETARRGDDGMFAHVFPGRTEHPELYAPYNQSHAPVRAQREAVGHAVRAVYLYTGMTDAAVDAHDEAIAEAVDALWEDVTGRKMYVTANIGTDHRFEAFGAPFELPNAGAYGETCASIGLANWAERLGNATRDARYFDVLELALYNGALAGRSADGTHYFYENVLSSDGTVERKEWFTTSCCPPNLARFTAALGRLVYSTTADSIAVDLLLASEFRTAVGAASVVVVQETDYPRTPGATIRVEVDRPSSFDLALRIPTWVENVRLAEGSVAWTAEADGYLIFDREWSGTAEIQLEFTLPTRRLHAHPAIADDRGKVAVQRGPLIYCLEEVDAGFPTSTASLSAVAFDTAPDSLSGQTELLATVIPADFDDPRPYTEGARVKPAVRVRLVPYFFWGNRGRGTMDVWLHQASQPPRTTDPALSEEQQ